MTVATARTPCPLTYAAQGSAGRPAQAPGLGARAPPPTGSSMAEGEPKGSGQAGGAWGAAQTALSWIVVVGVPVAICAAWIHHNLGHVDGHEAQVRPLGGLAYATFVQLADNFARGAGWVQTVHQGYAQDWRWGGHFTPLFPVMSWLAGLSSSPWALARLQVIAVGLGILGSARLGWAEGRAVGALIGAALYAGSAPIMLMALADYQDIVLMIPTLPLAWWAARHGSALAFVLCAALLGSTREEALVLLPVVGLAGGLPRAVLGALVSASFVGIYAAEAASSYGNPLLTIASFEAKAAAAPVMKIPPIPGSLYAFMGGPAVPAAALAPAVSLAAVPVMVFHTLDPESIRSTLSQSIHHLSPLVGIFTCGGVVGFARLCRLGRPAAALSLLLCLGAIRASYVEWEPILRKQGWRIDRGPNERAKVWGLLAQVPEDEVLYVDLFLVPAAARRPYVITSDSESEPQAIALLGGRPVRWALVQGDFPGTPIDRAAGYTLYKLDEDHPYPLKQRSHRPGPPRAQGLPPQLR